MKSTFSKTWKASKQPRKQVKYRANAPLHIRQKFVSAPLAKSLRERYGTRNVPVRKGDEVKVLRGQFKGKQGKITQVDLTQSRVQINGLQRTKQGGEKLDTWFNASNLLITAPDTSDAKRLKKKQTEEKKTQTTKQEGNKENAHKKK